MFNFSEETKRQTQSQEKKENVFWVTSLCWIALEKDFWGSFFKMMTDYLVSYAGCYPHFSHIFAHSYYYLQRELVYEIIRVIKAFGAELFPVSKCNFISQCLLCYAEQKGSARQLLKRLSISNSKSQWAKILKHQ